MKFVKRLTLENLPFGYRLLIVGLFIYLVTTGSLLWSWSGAVEEQGKSRTDRFGSTIVAQLAAMASESLLIDDRIRLNVLANRLIALPEVSCVSITTVDKQLLALACNQPDTRNGITFKKPISFENVVAGYVEVTLSEEAFRVPISRQVVLPGLVGLALSLLAIGLVGFAPSRLTGREPQTYDDTPVQEHFEESPVYLLVVNLFNQISISQSVRQEILDSAEQQARQVANVYGARVEHLPGTGLILVFDAAKDEDRCFQVLCAALLVQNLLSALSLESVVHALPRLKFRFGLHLCSSQAFLAFGESGEARLEGLMTSDQVNDAVLLSAVATDDSLAASADVFDLLEEPERVIAEQIELPILNSLATATPGCCYVVQEVAPPYQPLLDGQADLMLAQFASHGLDQGASN